MKAVDILKPGYITRIGKCDISLWYEKWLHKGRISDRIPYVDIHDLNIRVHDVFNNGSWNFNLLYTQLPDDIKLEMQSLFINPNSSDLLIWESSSTGEYSIKNAYSWLVHLTDPPQSHMTRFNNDRKWIWKLKFPENVKHFIWLVMQGSLPTNSFRCSRHITSDQSCHRCGASSETILHTLRDCPRVQQIWLLFGFDTLQDFNIVDPFQWFQTHATGEFGLLFSISCWMLWRARNEEVFSDSRWENWKTISRIRSLLDSTVKAFATTSIPKKTRLVSWSPPPEFCLKLNVDGSSFGNPGRSGFGGLFRDFLGHWILGFSGGCGYTTNMNAELQAIARGLNIAWHNGYRNIICESDSKVALSLIEDGVPQSHPHAPVKD